MITTPCKVSVSRALEHVPGDRQWLEFTLLAGDYRPLRAIDWVMQYRVDLVQVLIRRRQRGQLAANSGTGHSAAL